MMDGNIIRFTFLMILPSMILRFPFFSFSSSVPPCLCVSYPGFTTAGGGFFDSALLTSV